MKMKLVAMATEGKEGMEKDEKELRKKNSR
jgi:hypothetical protein